eukprot:GILJ01001148.1.p1 GENE.GILJ01001148.1~~GILJ01001148.1.p1  ORF type:complete len:537 (+),score=105.79 GILJ01001148.1:48-1658(+)
MDSDLQVARRSSRSESFDGQVKLRTDSFDVQSKLRSDSVSSVDGQSKIFSATPDTWLSVNTCQDVVAVNSLHGDDDILKHIPGLLHYESRMLWILFLLNNPKNRVVFTSALKIDEAIVDYLLGLLATVKKEDARNRLLMVACEDDSLRLLATKVAENPNFVSQIRDFLVQDRRSMRVFFWSQSEQVLAKEIGVPCGHFSNELSWLGTKAGSRQIFKQGNVQHPRGNYELLTSIESVSEEIVKLWEMDNSIVKVVVKLNDGVSGKGNAIFKLPSLAADMAGQERVNLVFKALHSDLLDPTSGDKWDQFLPLVSANGAIVEEFLNASDISSPSCQAFIHADGSVEIIATHEQILDGQVYLGCRFPSAAGYRSELQRLTRKVGALLAAKGGQDLFSVDYMAYLKADGSYCVNAIEINLRSGGTTHPYGTTKLLTQAYYDEAMGSLVDPTGTSKCYMATDNLVKPHFIGAEISTFLGFVAQYSELQFHKDTRTGPVFHLLGALPKHGKMGVTCIADSPQAAEEMFEKVNQTLDSLQVILG